MTRDEFSIRCRAENEWECVNPLNNVIYLRDEYEKYWEKVKNGENFAFLRYGDGELALMIGREITAQEGWHADSRVTLLGKKLRETLVPIFDGIVYGIPCPCCHAEGYYWYLRHLGEVPRSFANIWINGNFKRFMEDFSALAREAVLITNRVGLGKSYGNLRIKKHYIVSDDCVAFWEQECESLIDRITFEVGGEDGLLYAISAGPLSEVIIWELFKRNPRNCYIDFGSALDLFIHEKVTRPFMVESSLYARKNCWMFNPDFIQTDVDVVLTTYKRPEVLEQQLDAVLGQTLRPKRVLLYQDGIDSYYSINFSGEMLKRFDAYSISKTNGGVWKRFEYAKDAVLSKYVCIFDDDTIPGNRWLENCHMNMMQHRGVYGTNGILLPNLEYPYGGGGIHIGWHAPNEETAEVDFVGHSWFLETEWLQWMFANDYDQKYKYVGEDMGLSFSCIEKGIKTFVPAHPKSIQALWGSIPKYGNAYGGGDAAVHRNNSNISAMHDALQQYHQDGWRPIFEIDGGYVEKMKLQSSREWYLERPFIEVDKQVEAKILGAMQHFREAMRQYLVPEMASALLKAKPIIILAGLREHEERRIFLRYFLNVFLLGMFFSIQEGNHSMSLVFLTAIEETFLAMGKTEPKELLFYKGMVYYFRKEYVLAERYFVEYLEAFPRNEEAFFYAGTAATMQNALNRATEAYTHALSIKENYREVADAINNIVSTMGQGLKVSFAKEDIESFRKYSLSVEGMDFMELPIFIFVKEQISKLDRMLDWLLEAGYRNIYILDRDSIRSSRGEYYSRLERLRGVRVLYLKRELGDDTLWMSGLLNVLHIHTPYVYAETDGIPVADCPRNIVEILLGVLREFPYLIKVGLGINTDSRNDEMPSQRHDSKDSCVPIDKNVYFGASQSKFILYRNCYHNDIFAAAWTGGNLQTVQ